MKYLCLIHHDEAAMSAFTAAEMEAIDHASETYDKVLEAGGHMVFAHALRPARRARIVRSRGGKPVVTDGPYAESKEQLIGFILIEAADEAEAIKLAGGIPLARTGAVEVREIFDPFAG